ncbi:VanZ family protein [Agromyces sp. NPDC057865]|uniref:VanZ family protein n=1 Tax=Agromyces sp. NPDC057865 TaxID=3346267 RepID=UPI00367096EE
MTGERTGGRTALVVMFAVYLVLLVWIVLWKVELPWLGEESRRVIKLVPFVAGPGTGASRPLEVVANVLLFVPFGVYVGLLAPAWSRWRAAVVFAASSVALEVAQYVLAVGSSDVSDVIANTVGGLAGFGLLAAVRRRLRARTAAVMTRACAAGTAILLVASAVVAAAPVHYAPPGHDPGPQRTMPLQ